MPILPATNAARHHAAALVDDLAVIARIEAALSRGPSRPSGTGMAPRSFGLLARHIELKV